MRRILVPVLLVTALAAALAAAGWARPSGTRLTGTVGPGFSISLTQGGKKVTTLKAGTYTFAVSDRASIHDFVVAQVSGGHAQTIVTTVPFVGAKTATIKLTKGAWKVFCQPHASVMVQMFTVR